MLIGAVHLRVSSSRVFYRYRKALVVQDNLRLQLGNKQLKLEHLLNPNVISEQIEKKSDSDN